jgi:hypothetical protein
MWPTSRARENNRSPLRSRRRSARLASEQNVSHPLKIGDAVAIFAINPLGRPFIEGSARVQALCVRPHHYRVRFLNENRDCIRFVNPDWQGNPKRSCELLLEFWRASTSASPFEDFFPDETD